MNRTQASLKNFIWYNVSTLVTLALNFVLRTILIKTLGEVYVGISNLFTNILGMLSLAELGIGTAIGYNLYKPLAENDRPKIQALINFYRRAYRIVASVVFVIGVALIPFLPKIAKGSDGVEHLTFIYCIYIFNTVSSYLIAYKSTIIDADQKNYIITNVNTATNIIIVIFQMLVLLVFKNYVFYMLVSAVIGLARNVYLNYYTGKLYPFLRKRNSERLTDEEKKEIFTKIKALIYHSVGSVVVFQTDSIITSSIINVNAVGFVSNYNMIINAIKNFSSSFFRIIIPSVGNLLVLSDKGKARQLYKNVSFLCFCIANFTSTCLFFMLTPFIKIWIGEKYVMPVSVVFLLCINYYIAIVRTPSNSFKSAAGMFEKDKFSPILESIINLVVSIVLAEKIGIAGVYIGTFASSFVPLIWSEIIVGKYIVEESLFNIFKRLIFRTSCMLLCGGALYLLFKCVAIENLYIDLLFKCVVCLTIPNLMIVLVFGRTKEFKYLVSVIKKVLLKVLGKKAN